MKRKAFFSILTGMMFVIIVVVALLLFFTVYGLISAYEQATSKVEQRYEKTKVFKDNLLLCHEHLFLSEAKLATTECIRPDDPPYVVKQDAAPGCLERNWTIGTKDTYSNRFSYPVSVKQSSGNMCVASLIIYSN